MSASIRENVGDWKAELLCPARLAAANINPSTRLASDYLNHFNEAIMLLEMLADCPACIDDFLSWRSMTYREHFAASRFKDKHIAIAAYDAAEPAARLHLETLADEMTSILETTRSAMRAGMTPDHAKAVAIRAVADLKPVVARAGAIINGEADAIEAPQSVVDRLFRL